jgi:predicted PurR-regulated permease PerM
MTKPTEKQSRILWFALTGIAVATVIGLVVAGVWGLGKILNLLGPVLWPLAIAAVVACLLSPVVDVFEGKKIPRGRAIVLVFFIAAAVIAGVLVSIIPQIFNETQELALRVPDYSQRLQVRIQEFIAHPPEFVTRFLPAHADGAGETSAALKAQLAPVTDWLAGSLPAMGQWLLSQILRAASGLGLILGLVLIPVYAFYFLLEKRSIEKNWREFLPLQDSSAKEELVFVLDAISGYLVAFFRGQVLVALCDAVLYTIGFLMVGLNYAFLLGFAAVLLTMIPFLGAAVICITALTLAFVQHGDWQHPALVLAVFAVVQSLEGLVISPKIMGDRVGLHPLVIIIAVMTGTTLLGGILGGILAIPLAAALRVILARYVWKKN